MALAVQTRADLVRKVERAKREVFVVYFVLKQLEQAEHTSEREQVNHVNPGFNINESLVQAVGFFANENKPAYRNAQIGKVTAYFNYITQEFNYSYLKILT
jgi:hypothetical protein